jgi:hypothetical protein
MVTPDEDLVCWSRDRSQLPRSIHTVSVPHVLYLGSDGFNATTLSFRRTVKSMPQKRRNQCAVCGEWIRLYQRGVESCYQNDRKEAACPVVAEKLWR